MKEHARNGADRAGEFQLERYRYILGELRATNENVYRFVAIYQTLATAIAGGMILLLVSYGDWHIPADVARAAVVGLAVLVTIIGVFTTLLIIIGARAWVDYRQEECDLLDELVRPGFRERPQLRNLWRWYETYIALFIISTLAAMWAFAGAVVLPSIG